MSGGDISAYAYMIDDGLPYFGYCLYNTLYVILLPFKRIRTPLCNSGTWQFNFT